MPYVLNLVYGLLILSVSPWLLYSAIRKGKYRQGWSEKLLGRVPKRSGDRPAVWFHAVSVGEVNLLPAIIAEWQRRMPEWDWVVSTTTRTGYELAKKRFPTNPVFYCPLDFTWAVRAATRRIRPDLFVLAELELWPNLIREVRRRGVPVAVVNGRLSDRSYRGYKRIRWFLKKVLQRVDLIAAQNECYAQRFLSLGAEISAVHVTGSVKFDGAATDRNQQAISTLRRLWGLTARHKVFLAGSTQYPEEKMAIETFQTVLAHDDTWRLILVPRHPERFDEVADQLRQAGLPWQRRSELPGSGQDRSARALLVDCVGELGRWWGTADIGFVGGSMGQRGGQNMIEPAAYGVAVCFGPNTSNFRDIVSMLLQHDAARVVHDQQQLDRFVQQCADDPDFRRRLGTAAQRLVLGQQGAVVKTVDQLARLVATRASGRKVSAREAA